MPNFALLRYRFYAFAVIFALGPVHSQPSPPTAPAQAAPPQSAPGVGSTSPNSACQRNSPTLTTVATSSPALTAHTTLLYDVTVNNRDTLACPARKLIFQTEPTPTGFSFFSEPTNAEISPGKESHFTVSLTASSEVKPGSHALAFRIFDLASQESVAGQLNYPLAAPNACSVSPNRELLIIDPSVVDDPLRTAAPHSGDPRAGAWSFARLMTQLAPSSAKAADMVEHFFQIWLSDQHLNGFTVPARPGIQDILLDPWPRLSNGKLDLDKAPLRLLAIVNRMDLGTTGDKGQAGEGRFVFGVLDKFGNSLPFTLIIEYRLPAANHTQVVAWALAWHKLSKLKFPSEAYNAALQVLTDSFSSRTASLPQLNAIRTNEESLHTGWELRQFKLSAAGEIVQIPVEQTPSNDFISGSPLLADYINQHQLELVNDTHRVPLQFQGTQLLGGASTNTLEAWAAPNLKNAEARHHFSVGTCNGCHGSHETHTEFLHIAPRNRGAASTISAFLQGIAIRDPFSGELRVLNELGRRKLALERLLCKRTAG